MTLFQSVQLNINNPHFLIMQGRITKVLNMKPPEILAMIEEAAGTRMFEEKKDKALKTIAKKDQKLQEISDLMENDIAPKLDKLKKEKADFMNFQKIEGEVERLRRFMIAYDYMKSVERLAKSEREHQSKVDKIQSLEAQCEELEQSIRDLGEAVDAIVFRKEREMKKSGKFQELQQETNGIANTMTRLNTQHELKLTAIEDEKKQLSQLSDSKKKLGKSLEAGRKSLVDEEKGYQEEKQAVEEETERVKKQEGFLQTLSTGIAASEGQDNGFVEQMEEARAAKTQAGTELEQSKQRLDFVKDQLKSKQPKAKDAEKSNQTNSKQYGAIQQHIAKLKARREKLEIDPQAESELRRKRHEKLAQVRKVQETLDIARGQLSNLDFAYSEPYKGFDHSKVKGLVARLIQIDRDRLDYTTALQICAEGRLYFVPTLLSYSLFQHLT